MDKQVFALLEWLKETLGVSGIFFSCLAVSFALFFACLLTVLLKRGYGVKSRLWLVICTVSVLLADVAFTLYFTGSALFPLALFAFDVLTVGIALVLPQRQGVYTEESLSLAELLSKKAREQRVGEPPVYRAETERIRAGGGEVSSDSVDTSVIEKKDKADGEDLGLDFTHVKNVIERLNCFGLSQSDRRQVKELEASLLKAESGERGVAVKESINDGLSALLKIMSKYGV